MAESVYGRVECIRRIEVVRYKPGKRLVVVYHLQTSQGKLVLYGKIRAKGLHRSVFWINQQLYRQSDTLFADAGWQVPEPVCMLPECQMWLQKQVPGKEYTRLLAEPQAPALAERIATLSHSLHYSGLLVAKSHGIDQELEVLKKQLWGVAAQQPRWEADIHRLYDTLQELARPLANRPYHCIHRDFYPDQVIVSGQQNPRLYLLDLDLCCMGDPCLDIGNFVAHIQEQALRETGDLQAWQPVTTALVQHYLRLGDDPQTQARVIEIYRLLSLARHVAISHRIPGRAALTPTLLKLSLQQAESQR